MKNQMKRYIGQGPEGSQAQELLSPYSLSCHSPVHQPRNSMNPITIGAYEGSIT